MADSEDASRPVIEARRADGGPAGSVDASVNLGQGAGALVGSEVEALRSNLIRKTTLLVQRERDIQILLRQVQETNRWTELSAAIATRIATRTSSIGAVGALAAALAEDLSFEYAAVLWRGEYVEVPSFPSEPSRERARALMVHVSEASSEGVYAAWDDVEPGGLVDGVAARVSGRVGTEEPAHFFVGRTARTAAYSQVPPDHLKRSLSRLANVVAQAFGAVRLNIELAHERDSLQHEVEKATRDLRAALETAESARAHALRSATARSEFLANMSHEIRTPMTAVLGYADLLDEPGLSVEQRSEYIEVLRTSGKHLLQLIDDILDLARIESGRLRFDPQPSSIINVLQSVLAMLHGRAKDKGLTLSLLQGTPLPEEALVDAARLRQILINLVGNAIKFTDRGGVTIRSHYSGSTLQIAVSDTGIGVPPEQLSIIFEAFEQSNASTSRQYGGSGLGLAISRRLARLMGGDIVVESTVGIGSRFTLAIDARSASRQAASTKGNWPHRDAATAPSGTSRLRSSLESAPSPHAIDVVTDNVRPPDPALQREAVEATVDIPSETAIRPRILLVDDTAVNRVLLRRVLMSAGYDAVTANDGLEALTTLTEARRAGSNFDAVILDMHMPVVDGYEAARRMRLEGHQLPIIALTANAMPGDREKCIDAGCSDYLSKPIDRKSLIDMLSRVGRSSK